MINDNWLLQFTYSMVEFLAPEVSDHCPAFIQLQQENASPPKPFRFFNFWTKHSRFLEIVEESWRIPVQGNPMRMLHSKLKRLKQELRKFNQAQFGNISTKVAEKRRELADIQIAVLNSPNCTALIENERVISQEVRSLMQAEESYYRQKSRISWIKEGDLKHKIFSKDCVSES